MAGKLAIPILSLLLGAAAAIALVSCGDSSGDARLLPGENAKQIVDNLDTVADAAAAGNCDDARTAADQVGTQVEELKSEIDRELYDRLIEGVDVLQAQIDSDCDETTSAETTSEETTTETTDTDETTSEETTDETTDEETTADETTETTTEETSEESTDETTEPPTEPPTDTDGTGGVSPGGKPQGGQR